MGAVKLQKFLGEAPKLATEHLPESAAAFAYNTKFYSGDLIPYRQATEVATLAKTGEIKTIYPMLDGSGNKVWLHWTTDVDIAKASILNDTTQRVYFTGDGVPKVTNYSLATTGGTDYPHASYTLGLPAPETAPTVSASSFSQLTITHRARDAGNTATLTFAAAHNLNNGAYVTTTSVGGTGYNLNSVQITVTSATTISYYSPGSAEATTADAAGKVDLSGPTQARTYVYTWVTAWGEESVTSPVSSTLYMKDGQSVSITGLPSVWPVSYTGDYQTSGMQVRIYRTVSSSTSTLYYKVADVSLGTTSYTDTKQMNDLVTVLPSKYYDQPDPSMVGIKAIHNGVMVGFFKNTVCFSEPGQPHAWPIKYQTQVDANIVAIDNVGQTIVVLTEENPWVLQGHTPATMSKTKMDYTLTCTSKRGVVNMGYGLIFPAWGGLAMYSAGAGGDYVTKHVHEWDSWRQAVDPTTIIATQYNGKYFADHSTGGFVFEKEDKIGGFFVELSQPFTATYYDQLKAELYIVDGSKVYLWDDPAKPYQQFDWKSKTFVTKDFQNLGAARVVADYGANPNDALVAAENAQTLADNLSMIENRKTGGSLGGASFGRVAVAGSFIKPLQAVDAGVQFQLFVDKDLIFSTQVTDSNMFRLPTGYRSDTFEVRVTGNTRVRAIHLAETPSGLEKV